MPGARTSSGWRGAGASESRLKTISLSRLLMGFTLIEILLVTVLLSILIAVVTPRFRNTFDSLQYRNYVQDTAALMRYAHDRAMLDKQTYRLRFMPSPAAGCRLEKAFEKEFKPVPDRTGSLRALPKNVELEAEPAEVIFYPDGSATEAEWLFRDSKERRSLLRVSGSSGDVVLREES